MTGRAPLLLTLALAAAACGSSSTTSTTVTTPTSTRCEATVTLSTTFFGPAGGTGTLAVSVDRECAWRAATPVAWVTFTTSAEGQGEGTVGYRVAENADPVARQAMLSVAERQVALSQQGAPCRYTVSGVPTIIARQGGQFDISIVAHAACSWTARSEMAWATIAPVSGNGNAVLGLTVTENTGSQRPVTVTIAGERITAIQSAGSPAPAPTPPAPTPTPPTPPPAPTPTPPSPTPTPSPVKDVRFDGEVRNLNGACPALQFTVSGNVVFTTANTTFERGPCSGMRDGVDVEIRGSLLSDRSVRADRVRYKDND